LLAYFVIGVELAILYTVFWYVFLREPKPYKLKGSAWGVYDEASLDNGPSLDIKKFAMFGGSVFNNADPLLTEHGPNCGCKLEGNSQAAIQNALYEEWNAGSTAASGQFAPYVPLTAGELIRSQSRGVERVQDRYAEAKPSADYQAKITARQNALGYAPYNPAELPNQQRDRRKAMAFLAKLGDKLNRINVKIP
jgi:hypothetical protein